MLVVLILQMLGNSAFRWCPQFGCQSQQQPVDRCIDDSNYDHVIIIVWHGLRECYTLYDEDDDDMDSSAPAPLVQDDFYDPDSILS